MRSKKQVLVSKKREIKTYTELWHTSYCLLQKGIELPKGCSHQFGASLVFTAFALEAFLNHIGHNLFKCWDELERRLGPREKLNIIAERLQVDVNYGILPWQIVKELFDFRNEIAHGKSKKISSPDKLITLDNFSDTRFGEFIRTKWEEDCTRENAEKARTEVNKIVLKIYEKGDFENDYPFTFGLQSGTAKVIKE